MPLSSAGHPTPQSQNTDNMCKPIKAGGDNFAVNGVIVCADPDPAIAKLIERIGDPDYAIVTDSTVEKLVLPRLPKTVAGAKSVIVIPAGEENKSTDSLTHIWQSLSSSGLTRKGLVVNIGGGMVSDIGGFAAATFKRGINCVNVPTTLLGAVDASVGGKTGIDLGGLKNEVGAFHDPAAVVLSSSLFDTLPFDQMLSGYGEMLKMGLLCGREYYEELLDVERILGDNDLLNGLMHMCVAEKLRIVETDPHEKSLRKVLNFGHTAGHAIETIAMEKGRAMPHGCAVALGISEELWLSVRHCSLPESIAAEYDRRIVEPYYRKFMTVGAEERDRLREIAGHDKKNLRPGVAAFTLLRSIGEPVINVEIPGWPS